VRLSRGGAAIADQGFSSGATFFASVAVAARLPVEEHGRFGFALALLGLLLQLHGATVVDPALMHARGRFRDRAAAHQASVWRLHGRFLALAMGPLLALALGGLVLGSASVDVLVALLVVAPVSLSLHLGRRLDVAVLRPERAAQRSGAFALAALGGLAALDLAGRLGAATALLALGAGAAIVLLADLRRLRPTAAAGGVFEEVLAAHRDHAGWGVGSSLASWVPRHGLYVLLPAVAGAAGYRAAGILRTHMLLMLPMMIALAALASMQVSVFAQRRAEGQRLSLGPAIAGAVGGSALYGALVVLGGGTLIGLTETPSTSSWRLLVALTGVLFAAPTVLSAALLARAQSRAYFAAWAAGAVALGAAAGPLLRVDLTLGAFLLLPVSYGATLLALAVAVRRAVNVPGGGRPRPSPRSSG
jgi:hypothetical protein